MFITFLAIVKSKTYVAVTKSQVTSNSGVET